MAIIERKVHKIDAADESVGRLGTRIALILRGKNKPEYTPNIDSGDIVEVTNIKKLKFTGKKLNQKKYFHYSGYPGGLKTKKMSDVYTVSPGEVLERAVKQMLPANRLRNGMMKRLIIR
jgi:large subunit ribosomal protein L13